MRKIHEVSKLTGVSVRALHHYDRIGLLPATQVTEKGYRLYDDAALERLQHILLFKELQFSLKEIKEILDSPDFDREKALTQQIRLLELKREHLDNLLILARGIKETGVKDMDFSAFDTKKMDEYARQAKASWGTTPEYQEFEQRSKGRSREEEQSLGVRFMSVFAEIGKIRDGSPEDPQAKALAKKIQDFITENYYTCSDEILLALGEAYAGGGPMTENIDRAGGEGTGAFACRAIRAYVASKKAREA
ncbi:MAG: MerR family transcriptional regulator [Lachnospiraceae bacterium]|nr:MerR family transcriptional regulator [Lachnospiraceae bacterium]